MKEQLRSLIRELVTQEMSTTGTGASMASGQGEQYATPKAFKKKNNKQKI